MIAERRFNDPAGICLESITLMFQTARRLLFRPAEEIAALRREARYCRDVAASISLRDESARMIAIAKQYEARAAAIEAQVASGAGAADIEAQLPGTPSAA